MTNPCKKFGHSLGPRIFLKDSKVSNVFEYLHKGAEYLIFFRWPFFKNRPRSTYLLFRSLMLNTLIFSGYYALFSHIKFLLMGIEVDPILLYTAGVITGYWGMQYSFSQKCNYLSGLYNDVLKAQTGDSPELAIVTKLNFSAQLLTMDLWGHRLYSWLFVESLEEAIRWQLQEGQSDFESLPDFINKADAGKLRVSQVRQALLAYQRAVLESKQPRTQLREVS